MMDVADVHQKYKFIWYQVINLSPVHVLPILQKGEHKNRQERYINYDYIQEI